MYSVKPGQAVDDSRTVKEALEFALEHSRSPEKWTRLKYKAGLMGFDNWIHALDAGTVDGNGMGYNTVVWNECRGFAVGFLREAKERLKGKSAPLFDEAVEHYQAVQRNLERVAELFPFTPNSGVIEDAERCRTAQEYLKNAREAEEAGLGSLGKIAKEL
jgi:hypothetical protein